jgi:hypothetical protein
VCYYLNYFNKANSYRADFNQWVTLADDARKKALLDELFDRHKHQHGVQ